MNTNKPNNRIEILDGFRTIAILSVILFHFFSRYTNSYYPYGDKYNFFKYGYLGVYFFFIISGFVISFTLENTQTFIGFWKRRFIRLYPSMIISSILIFIIMRLFDENRLFESAHEPKNFISSITFLPPTILKTISHHIEWTRNLRYLNSSFWTLWPEVQFYLISSTLYFFSKENFFRNLIFTAIALITLFLISSQLKVATNYAIYLKIFYFIFSIGYYISYFIFGVIFFKFFKNRQLKETNSKRLMMSFFCLIIIHFSVITDHNITINLINVGMLISFILFIYYPKCIDFLKNRYIAEIGLSSYFLYLIHEPIGVLLINLYAKYFQPLEFLFTILLIVVFCIASILYYRKVEKKLTKLLYSYFF